MSHGTAPDLEPEIEVACAVCGRSANELLVPEDEVKAQLAYLEDFHRRRLRPVEGASDAEPLADRADFTQNYSTDIVRCRFCGLVFRESRPRASRIAAAYERDHYGRERLAALFDSQLELSRGKAERLRRLLPVGATPRIAEVGSFVGGFLAAARERGWSAVGIDPGEEVGEFCREKGFAVLQTTAPEAPVEAESLDCVAIWNTFDQLADPRPTIAAAHRWLKGGGLFAVRVPNGAAFRSAIGALRPTPAPLRRVLLAAMAWNNLLAFPYLHGHSVATLDRLLAPFGFERIAADGDVLTRLADDRTRAWAAWEERLLKAAWRGLARVNLIQAPWIDAYYRRVE